VNVQVNVIGGAHYAKVFSKFLGSEEVCHGSPESADHGAGNPSVTGERRVDPTGILPKLYNADRYDVTVKRQQRRLKPAATV
jgi:hypothetical protein